MRRNKGFTLIELMVVILIVAILAAVLVPLISGRVNDAKWSEGKAGAGTVATALRAWCVERGMVATQTDLGANAAARMAALGFKDIDLKGKYFAVGNYDVTVLNYDPAATTPAFTYTIQVTAPTQAAVPGAPIGGPLQLNQDGLFSGL